jgi:peptide alpha-N-acetyltransferase
LRPDAERSDGYEDSELYLFQTDCLIKQSKYEEAIKFLKRSEDSIVDMLSHKVKLAELYILSGKFNEARTSWTHLVLEQPDNYRFHCGLQVSYLELDPTTSLEMFSLKKLQLPSTTLQLSKEQMVVLKDMYVASNFKTRNVSKILLTVCSDRDELKVALDKHLRSSLHNAMPALYHDIFSLVSIPDPVNQSSHVVFASDPIDIKQHEVILITRELVDKYISNLRSHEQFEDLYDPSLPLEPPTSFLWALYLKAHILEMCNELKEALVVIDESIQHTPTAIDMYCKKARILKKLGDVITAAVVMDDCRMLDLQDRYLNNKATKYYLRIDETELAMNTIALFVKHDGEPQKILYDLQCNWYELEVGESLARTKQWGGALRKFHAIKKHFFDYVHDMIDFHSYCVRKVSE